MIGTFQDHRRPSPFLTTVGQGHFFTGPNNLRIAQCWRKETSCLRVYARRRALTANLAVEEGPAANLGTARAYMSRSSTGHEPMTFGTASLNCLRCMSIFTTSLGMMIELRSSFRDGWFGRAEMRKMPPTKPYKADRIVSADPVAEAR